jgi:predicted HAD superfamily hydrolase
MRQINSFDVFDTLIARRSVEPVAVLRKLETQAELPGLAAARIAADQQLGFTGRPYQLAEIWSLVQRSLGLDAATTERLLRMEHQLEHAEVIPIVENLDLVRDGDVLVSDSYLGADTLRSLLSKAGFQRQAGIVISNDGKHRGWIWPELLKRVAIREHLGDNPHSDGQTPWAAGIKAVLYNGARRTAVEEYLAQNGCAKAAGAWCLRLRQVRQPCRMLG